MRPANVFLIMELSNSRKENAKDRTAVRARLWTRIWTEKILNKFVRKKLLDFVFLNKK